MMNWIYQWYQPGGSQTTAEVAETMADFVVSGLACDPATHTPGHRRELAPLPPIPPQVAEPDVDVDDDED